MGKNKNSKREEKKIGGGSLADQLAAVVFATTVDKDENKVEITENAFINPYTFIPIGDEEPSRKNPKDVPAGEELYDGYLDCSLEIKSSTYIPNTSKKFEYLGNDTEHYFYDFFSYEDLSNCPTDAIPNKPPKYPRIPGSEIRGMVRNVYEQLTNSCLSVIDEENLPYKRTPTPKEAGLLDIASMKLYKAERVMLNSRNRYADVATGGVKVSPGTYQTGDEVYIVKSATTFVTSNGYITNTHTIKSIRGAVGAIAAHECKGYVIIGESFGRKKHHDSVIIGQYDAAGMLKGACYNITEADISRFEAVLDRYDLGLTSDHHGYKAYRSVYENMREQNMGLLPIFYSEVGGNIYLSPAMITKEVFEHTISDILRDNHNRHEPCSGDDGCFCPACRLFGMVGKGKEKKAIASRLRFTDTEVFKNPKFDLPKVPVVLGTPRYSATEFYLQEPDEELGAEYWNYDYYTKYNGNSATNTPYSAKLSGRKVYWLGEDKNTDAELVSMVREGYNNKHGADARNDYLKQNQLKMRQAIRALMPEDNANSTEFRIYFENITKAELGNLIFCINLSDKALNRIGKGKPLGMGAVKTAVKGVNIVEYQLEDGEINRVSSVSKDKFKYEDRFKHNAESIIKYLTPLTEEEAKIVDYPRPDNSSDIFRWFVTNRGTSIQKPKIEQTLPLLNDESKWLRKNHARHV